MRSPSVAGTGRCAAGTPRRARAVPDFRKRNTNLLMKALIIVLCLVMLQVPALAGQRPNVVFILTDDQRWDALGCMGQRASADAAHRPARGGRGAVQEPLLHDLALFAEPGVDPGRALCARARGGEQLHRLPAGSADLSAAAAGGGIRHRLHRQVAHGRGGRQQAARDSITS